MADVDPPGGDSDAAPVAGTPVALILAAGAGSRFRGPGHKLDAPLRGRPVLERAVDHPAAVRCRPPPRATGPGAPAPQ